MSKPVLTDLFAFSGRRNRQSYFLYGLLLLAFQIVLWSVAAALLYGIGGWLFLVLAGLISIPCAVSGWAVGSQRCRDFGWTGWAMLITIIPYVGWIFAVAILFIPGTQGENRYGPDPLGTVPIGVSVA